MRILVAPSAFKESLTAAEAAGAIAAGARKAGASDLHVDLCPVSDGGGGFVSILSTALRGTRRKNSVCGPLGVTVEAEWSLVQAAPEDAPARGGFSALLDVGVWLLGAPATAAFGPGPHPSPTDGRVALIEMSAAAGLALVPNAKRDPEKTTSYGVGELIRDALDARCALIYIGVGDSATCDGGAGAASALGARFFRDDTALRPTPHKLGGGDLAGVARVSLSGLDKRLREARIVVACDVRNPLLGPRGSARVFGPQKGASPEQVDRLDAGLANYARVCAEVGLKADPEAEGAGAAGGLAFGLAAFCGAELARGVDLVLHTLDFDRRAAEADLIITGEGRFDSQSAGGKACHEVALRARAAGKPIVALVGAAESKSAEPFDRVEPIAPPGMPAAESMRRAAELLEAAAERTVRDHLAIAARRP